jgi:hypothetical protein
LTTGDTASIDGVADYTFCGVYTVTVTNANVFTYSQTASGASSSGGFSTKLTGTWGLYAGGTGPSLHNGPVIVSASSQMPALRVTQGGNGYAFIVEDAANPDTSAFIISNAGDLAINTNKFTVAAASGNTVIGGTTSFGGNIVSNVLFTDATYDIGASGASRPRDLFLSRNLTVGGTLTLAGGVNLNGNVTIGDASSDTLTINSTITSNLIFTDNTYDIGASGATRPRNLYLAGLLTMGGALSVTGATTLTGALNANGAVTLGDAVGDAVTVNGTVTSNLIFTDNTYDIGAAVATRPRNLYVGTSITVSANGTYAMYAYNSTNTRKVWFATSSANTIFYNTDAAGGIIFRNAADSGFLGYWTDAGVLMLGGVTTNTASSPILFVNAASNQTVAAFGSLNAWSASTTNNAGISVGCYYNGVWNATATSGTFYQQIAGAHNWYANAGLTIGSTFSESKVMTVDYTGYLLNQSTVAAGVVRHESLNLSTAASSTADFVARVGNASSSYVQIQATQAGPGYLTFGATQTSGNIIVAGNYSLNIQTNSTNRMAIANDGRVAIGYGATFAQQLNENQLTVFGSANASAFVTTGGASTSPILSWSKAALAGGTTFTTNLDLLAGSPTYTSYGVVGIDSDGYAGIKSNVYNVVLDSYTGITNFHYRGNKWGIEVGVDGTATNVHYLQSYDRASSSYRPLGLIGQTVRMYNSATETWRFESNNLVAQVNNGGIQFKNTSALTNSVLNDYETGTWTITMNFGGTACTNTNQTCTYVKVGKMVTATVQGSGWTKGAGIGTIGIGGLPFSSQGSYGYGNLQMNTTATGKIIYSYMPYISGTSARILCLATIGAASGHRDVDNADMDTTFNMYGVFTYEANF